MFMNFLALFPKLSLSFRVVFLFLFISLLYLFLLAFLLHLMVLAFSSYLLQMNIVLVACCNKLLTTNFVAYNNRHVSSYSSEGDGPRISHQTQIKLWAGRFLLEAGQSLRPCLFRALAPAPCPPRPRPLSPRPAHSALSLPPCWPCLLPSASQGL